MRSRCGRARRLCSNRIDQYLFQTGLLDKWREGDRPSDAVFQAGATYSLEQGVQGFDPAAFIECLRTRTKP